MLCVFPFAKKKERALRTWDHFAKRSYLYANKKTHSVRTQKNDINMYYQMFSNEVRLHDKIPGREFHKNPAGHFGANARVNV